MQGKLVGAEEMGFCSEAPGLKLNARYMLETWVSLTEFVCSMSRLVQDLCIIW